MYADRAELPLHAPAMSALKKLAEGDAVFAIPIFCVGEFVRVVSHPRLFNPPTPATEALAQVRRLLDSPVARVLVPGPRFLVLFAEAIGGARASGNLVFDAMIAALCRESGVSALLTEDRDFARFPGLETRALADL